MSSTSNPKVTIIDEDGTPVGVGVNGLKVDVGDNIELTIGDIVTAKQTDPDDLKVGMFGNTAIDGDGTWRAPLISIAGRMYAETFTQGMQQQNETIVADPIIIGAEGFGSDFSSVPAIVSGRAVQLITDSYRNLYTRPKSWVGWTNYGPLNLDGTLEQLSGFGGGLGIQSDCYEIILQAIAENDGYIAICASGSGDLDKGIRMDAGDTLVLPVYSTIMIYMKASDATQKINVTIVK